MIYMKKIDHLDLDGHTLTTFLTVLEESSVSRAAERLGVSQSAVSHTLDKLRKIFDDPLFIRVGRGIESTAKARSLRDSLEAALESLKSLTYPREFDPYTEQMEFTVATNDFPLQLVFPTLLKDLAEQGIDLRIRFIPAGIPSVSLLRASRYRLLITPATPKDPDIQKVNLVRSRMQVFYDATKRSPPKSKREYAGSKHVEVRFSDTEASLMASSSIDASSMSPPVITVPNFGSLAAMIKGTDRITTQIGAMQAGLLQDLGSSPLPFRTEELDLFLVWHRREHEDPAHQWFRQKIIGAFGAIFDE
jgi:DNA-binding transcriptional LysR family regulator